MIVSIGVLLYLKQAKLYNINGFVHDIVILNQGITTEERIVPNGVGQKYEYYLTDHLGISFTGAFFPPVALAGAIVGVLILLLI